MAASQIVSDAKGTTIIKASCHAARAEFGSTSGPLIVARRAIKAGAHSEGALDATCLGDELLPAAGVFHVAFECDDAVPDRDNKLAAAGGLDLMLDLDCGVHRGGLLPGFGYSSWFSDHHGGSAHHRDQRPAAR